MNTFTIGTTIRLRASFVSWNNVPTDPTDIILRLYTTNGTQYGTDILVTNANKVSTGVYDVYYTIPSDSPTLGTDYVLNYKFTAQLELQNIAQGSSFRCTMF